MKITKISSKNDPCDSEITGRPVLVIKLYLKVRKPQI